MLWNLVFDFYVMYIFGGFASDGSRYLSTIGGNILPDGTPNSLFTYQFVAYEFVSSSGTQYLMTLGNYLSLISTIITMIIIVVCCAKLVLYIFNTMRRIIS